MVGALSFGCGQTFVERSPNEGALDAAANDDADAALPIDGSAVDGTADGAFADGSDQPAFPDAALDAASDAASDAGEPCPGLFCDGFESGDTSAWDRIHAPSGGTVNVVSEPVHRGRFAMESIGSDTSDWGAILLKDAFSVDTRDHWLRAYYFFPDSRPSEYITFSDVSFEYSVVSYRQPDRIDLHSHQWREDEFTQTEPFEFPIGEWVCVELHLQTDASGGVVELFANGALLVRHEGGTDRPEGHTTIGVGTEYQDLRGSQTTTYVDDVVASDERIGCD
ncbi:MAG: hypothetical protein AAF411_02105 [Myxococcota bacterium]